MPNVSGSVFFDSSLNQTGTTAIANVEVVLQDTSSLKALIVSTDSSGNFTFTNVPAGTYILVESSGFSEGTVFSGTGDFGVDGTTMSIPVGTDPPASDVPSAPTNTNLIHSTTANTINLTVAAANITGQIFRDGPFTNTPLVLNDITYIGGNLITSANDGDWGTLPAANALNARPATAPYPGVVPGFTYTNGIPSDGSYTVTNLTNPFGSGFIADHTQGDETGRYQIVNGANPGSSFFTETIPVLANTYYQFSAWMLNLTGGALPQLGYQIKTLSGSIIFQENAPAVSLTTPRTWLELGTFFGTGSNTAVVVNFLSQGPAAGGNDYAMDDFFLIQASINDIVTTEKYVDKNFANVGDTLNYQVVIKNTGNSTITNMTFNDTLPIGTIFKSGSMLIDNTPSANTNRFTFGSPQIPMPPGDTITVSFNVTVATLPTINPLINNVLTNYGFAPENGGTTVPNAVNSNSVSTEINNGDIGTSKTVSNSFASVGDILTYTIPMQNYGNTTSNNIVLIDTIPNGTSFITDSLTIDGVVQTGSNPNPPSGASVGTIPAGGSSVVSFKVLVTTIPSPNPVTNNASLNYNFLVDPITTTFRNSGVNTNAVSTQIVFADLSSTKFVNKTFSDVVATLNYTIAIKNAGNVSANNIVFSDTIPTGGTFIPGTVQINSTPETTLDPNPPGFTITNPVSSINPNGTITITFNVLVTTLPTINPLVNNSTQSYSFLINPTLPTSKTSSINSNSVSTTFNKANLGNIQKSVSKAYATCGELLTYTITVPNNGNATALGVIIKDTIPNNTIFVPGTVTIDGNQTSFTPISMIVGTIPAGSLSVISFQVRVNC